jgi:hypothetical protein
VLPYPNLDFVQLDQEHELKLFAGNRRYGFYLEQIFPEWTPQLRLFEILATQNTGRWTLVSTRREPFSRKKQTLNYLCDDLKGRVAKVRDLNGEGDVDIASLNHADDLISEVVLLDLGMEQYLNEIQYLFGGMQVSLWEWSTQYMLLEQCISEIQEFLDFKTC